MCALLRAVRPIKTERANQVFNPPACADDWCDPVWVERTTQPISDGRTARALKLTYELDPNDLVHLNAGARIELTIFGDGMPPVSLGIAPAEVPAISDDLGAWPKL